MNAEQYLTDVAARCDQLVTEMYEAEDLAQVQADVAVIVTTAPELAVNMLMVFAAQAMRRDQLRDRRVIELAWRRYATGRSVCGEVPQP
ncbi:hypothetical protein FK268_12820 [Tsukamurella sputi]|uniref:Uncharacterized protein n=1 Tax=Tsukamurella sputi TaxID=2591848 RepID=A0A5C5RJL1_9ACTN|nr:hypothetical protein [Tsukamurella sputi]TWS23196.1 hypothetical protein FK268_12820 [Tsukamurella sputi]